MLEKIKKTLISVLIITIWSGLCITVGYFISPEKEKIKIVEQTKTEFKYIKTATTLPELQQCYDNPLGIKATVENDFWVKIVASDDCKIATKSVKIKSPVRYNNIIYFNIGIETRQLLYYRSFGRFSFGGGMSYLQNQKSVDFMIGAGFKF